MYYKIDVGWWISWHLSIVLGIKYYETLNRTQPINANKLKLSKTSFLRDDKSKLFQLILPEML